MKRLALIALAIAIVAAGVALVVTARSGSKPGDETAKAAPDGQSRAAADGDRAARARAGVRRAETRPSLRRRDPAGNDSDGDGDATPIHRVPRSERAPVRTYVREDGTVVSDFRPAPGETRPDPGRFRPSGNSRLERKVVSGLRGTVRPPLKACTDDIPPEQLARRSAIQADVTVSVQGGTATITATRVRGRNLDKSVADVIARCVQARVEGVAVAAEGQADVDSYSLSLPFRVGP